MDVHKAGTKPKSLKRKRDMKSEGLPIAWEKILEKNYSVFHNNLRIDKLIAQMPFTADQKEEFRKMLDDEQRIDHLIKHILPNGTKSLVEEFKNGLKLSGQENLIQYTPGHLTIIRPKRKKVDEIPIMIHVNGLKYIKLKKYNNQLKVIIREYIHGADGKLHPTKKGFMLSLDAWNALIKVNDIVQLMSNV